MNSNPSNSLILNDTQIFDLMTPVKIWWDKKMNELMKKLNSDLNSDISHLEYDIKLKEQFTREILFIEPARHYEELTGIEKQKICRLNKLAIMIRCAPKANSLYNKHLEKLKGEFATLENECNLIKMGSEDWINNDLCKIQDTLRRQVVFYTANDSAARLTKTSKALNLLFDRYCTRIREQIKHSTTLSDATKTYLNSFLAEEKKHAYALMWNECSRLLIPFQRQLNQEAIYAETLSKFVATYSTFSEHPKHSLMYGEITKLTGYFWGFHQREQDKYKRIRNQIDNLIPSYRLFGGESLSIANDLLVELNSSSAPKQKYLHQFFSPINCGLEVQVTSTKSSDTRDTGRTTSESFEAETLGVPGCS